MPGGDKKKNKRAETGELDSTDSSQIREKQITKLSPTRKKLPHPPPPQPPKRVVGAVHPVPTMPPSRPNPGDSDAVVEVEQDAIVPAKPVPKSWEKKFRQSPDWGSPNRSPPDSEYYEASNDTESTQSKTYEPLPISGKSQTGISLAAVGEPIDRRALERERLASQHRAPPPEQVAYRPVLPQAHPPGIVVAAGLSRVHRERYGSDDEEIKYTGPAPPQQPQGRLVAAGLSTQYSQRPPTRTQASNVRGREREDSRSRSNSRDTIIRRPRSDSTS